MISRLCNFRRTCKCEAKCIWQDSTSIFGKQLSQCVAARASFQVGTALKNRKAQPAASLIERLKEWGNVKNYCVNIIWTSLNVSNFFRCFVRMSNKTQHTLYIYCAVKQYVSRRYYSFVALIKVVRLARVNHDSLSPYNYRLLYSHLLALSSDQNTIHFI